MKFTLAIIDTNIFVKSGCDFLGIKSKMLPALFETISEKGLTLLQSDIVDGEVKAHIRTSANCATNRTVLRSKTDAERSERTH